MPFDASSVLVVEPRRIIHPAAGRVKVFVRLEAAPLHRLLGAQVRHAALGEAPAAPRPPPPPPPRPPPLGGRPALRGGVSRPGSLPPPPFQRPPPRPSLLGRS